MKDKNIIRNKLWEGGLNNQDVYFPTEFYSQKDILYGIYETFDLKKYFNQHNIWKNR